MGTPVVPPSSCSPTPRASPVRPWGRWQPTSSPRGITSGWYRLLGSFVPCKDVFSTRTGERMQPPASHWPPDEGTPARVKENGLVGTVIQVKGVYERRF